MISSGVFLMKNKISKKKKDNYREFFLTNSTEDVDSPQATNLSMFSTQLSYISSFVSSGKLSPEDADIRIRDLYKAWKQANKSIENNPY